MSTESKEQSFHIFEKHYSLPLSQDDSDTKKRIITEATILFAKNGYASVSVKDIARSVDITPASLYNYFEGKESLFDEVLEHAKELYMLYFNELDKQMRKAESFEEILEIIFREPKKMDNTFTCYAFSLIQAEQLNNEHAYNIMNDIFLTYSIDFFAKHFDECISQGLVPQFDTKTVATLIMNSVLCGITASVQGLLGRKTFYEPGKMMTELQQFIISCVIG